MEEQILQELRDLIDEDYKSQLLEHYPIGAREVLGVPIPNLHELARELACRSDWRNIVDNELSDNTFEEFVLKVLITSGAAPNYEETIERMQSLIGKIDTTQLCDAICLSLHIVVKYPEETLRDIVPYLTCNEELKQRFAIVTLMDYFVKADYIDRILKMYANVFPSHESVQQALAWGYQTCFLGYPQKTLKALQASPLPTQLFNSLLQRIAATPRIKEEQRKLLLILERS